MKPWIPVVLAACGSVGCVAGRAQAVPQTGPVTMPPQTVEMEHDGRCRPVRPGDTVHFALTIEGVANAQSVMAQLQLRIGHGVYREADLPLPGAGDMGGGGVGVRDGGSGKVYHFSFTVAPGVATGVYRGAGVAVTADYGTAADKAVEAEIDRRVREQVRHFCLAVYGPAENQPVVTDFRPEGVDRK